MDTVPNKLVLSQVETLFHSGAIAGLSDDQLLDRFLRERRDVADLAFSALVHRHGPMVLRVCRGVLRNPADADDAFQATFLVLARRAGAVQRRDSLASWLYGVALRVSCCARASLRRRREYERRLAERPHRPTSDDSSPGELLAVIHEEIGRLSEHHRAVVLLCHVDGLGCDDAARQLGWPVGTVKSRLARGRARLQARLVRRGIVPAVAAAALVSTRAPSVSAGLIDTTLAFAGQLASGKHLAPSTTSTPAFSYMKGALRTMYATKLKTVAGAVILAGLFAVGAGALARQTGDEPVPAPAVPPETATAPKPVAPEDDQKRVQRLETFVAELRDRLSQAEHELEALKTSRTKAEEARETTPAAGSEARRYQPSPTASSVETKPAQGSKKRETRFREIGGGCYFVYNRGDNRVAIVSTRSRKAWPLELAPPGEEPLDVSLSSNFNPGLLETILKTQPDFVPLSYLHINGNSIPRIAVFDFKEAKWHAVELHTPAKGRVAAVRFSKGVLYTIGRDLYAFSAQAKRWDVLELQDVPGQLPVGQDGIRFVGRNGVVHNFDWTTGKWENTDIPAILESILDEQSSVKDAARD